MKWPDYLQSPALEPRADYPLHFGRNIKVLPFTGGELKAIETFAALADEKYRISIFESLAVSVSYPEAVLKHYPNSFNSDIETMYFSLSSLFSTKYSGGSNQRLFIHRTAFRLQGIWSAASVQEAAVFYDSLIAKYDTQGLKELVQFVSTVPPLVYATPLLAEALRRKLISRAFGKVEMEELKTLPFSWIMQMLD